MGLIRKALDFLKAEESVAICAKCEHIVLPENHFLDMEGYSRCRAHILKPEMINFVSGEMSKPAYRYCEFVNEQGNCRKFSPAKPEVSE